MRHRAQVGVAQDARSPAPESPARWSPEQTVKSRRCPTVVPATGPQLLVASDLSDRSERAVDRAVLLAATLGKSLTVLHVIDEHLPSALIALLLSESSSLLQAQVHIGRRTAPPHVTVQVSLGNVEEAILDIARAIDAPLVIFGTHRRTEESGTFRNSVPDRVLRHCKQSVLVVRRKALAPYEHILVATDLSSPSRVALRAALRLFPNARFMVTYADNVSTKDFLANPVNREESEKNVKGNVTRMLEEEITSLKQEVPDAQPCWSVSAIEGTPVPVILRQVAAIAPDLVVVGTHGHTGFRRFIIGSQAEELIGTLPCDVLAVHPESRV